MKKIFKSLILLALSCIFFVSCNANATSGIKNEITENATIKTEVTQMNQTTNVNQNSIAKQEYESMINDLTLIPVNFVYDNIYYSGFNSKYFTEVSHEQKTTGAKTENNYVLSLDDTLTVKLLTAYYEGYEAWDYTVYFENTSTTENSKVLRKVNAIDKNYEGANAHLKGILGDHGNQYTPYDYDLSTKSVNFTSLEGRATHYYFPYFNLEMDNGGAMLAIGWGGTWQADFSYDSGNQIANFKGTGTVGLETYLKPGETVRTPLIAQVRYYEKDEDTATNAWRRWMVDCNMPKTSTANQTPVEPFTSALLAFDSDRTNTDGSIAEHSGSWQQSLDAIYAAGIDLDYRWVDAGWYFDPYNQTVPGDWWGTVGTWELDTVKWPDNSFQKSVNYALAKGTKTFLWFEPERVTNLDGMVANYNYDRNWVLSTDGKNNSYLNNLGNKKCLEWTLNRITTTMENTGVHMYREDFNMDPAQSWQIGDGYQGSNRVGITENLYMQGHYALWDGIISYCGENGKDTFIDSCASGGGRNDLESMRRAVPLLRSDSDRTTIELRLAMTTTLVKWIPFTGCMAKESASQLDGGSSPADTYVFRASTLPHFSTQAKYSRDPAGTINWDAYRQGVDEWKQIKPYFYKDFYVLTPYNSVTDSTKWTVYEYFDSDTDSGIIQAFRQQNCNVSSVNVSVKGVNPNAYYTLTDFDKTYTVNSIKGSDLIDGYTFTAPNPRTALVFKITPIA